MKYAGQISEVINAFSPEPLNYEQMSQFYCADTMEYRMSDKYSSPMEDIFDICQESGNNHAFLLLGHRGCGKSTELNRMSKRLTDKGYYVKTVACSLDLDLQNIVYSDLFILMGEALLEIARDSACEIDKDVLDKMLHFWDEKVQSKASEKTEAISAEAGMGVGTKGILTNILDFFVNMKADLKYNEETRVEYRRTISNRSSEWMRLLRLISESITKNSDGKQPIVIFEDLDKLNPDDAWKVFYNYAAVLSGMPFCVIYTFPIALSYDAKFSAIEGYFITKTLPMIKIATMENESFQEGIDIIKNIVEKRAKLDIFENGVLERLIQFTGGSLRDLFQVINSSAKRAERRESSVISKEDADHALEELKTSLTRRIESSDYDFLINIYKGNKEEIEDKEKLLKMLQASVVLEYNGKRWHNVHPLVVQFFKDQRRI